MSNIPYAPRPVITTPKIYAYSSPMWSGLLKIGYTTRTVKERVKEQYVKQPDAACPFEIQLEEDAIRPDGSTFRDSDVHKLLIRKGFQKFKGEWFKCTVEDVKAAIVGVRRKVLNKEGRQLDFAPRAEQREAIRVTKEYFEAEWQNGRTPKFLWNAKMRFGKTFTAYEFAKTMGFNKILVLTFKPAVMGAWKEDLLNHIDFEGWQFVGENVDDPDYTIDQQYDDADKDKPIVCFGSFQDFLGYDKQTGGIKPKNTWVHTTNWDLVIFDEYHYGAWRDNAKKLFHFDEDEFDEVNEDEKDNAYDETWLPITSRGYLYLSGTPFRAIRTGEFIEDQIFTWTYSDEQAAKKAFAESDENPYKELPEMVLLAYRMPEEIRQIALKGEFDEFDLNEFFRAEEQEGEFRFAHEDYVQKWLNLIRGANIANTASELRAGADRPPMPFSDANMLQALTHTLWFLPNVASCKAMAQLLKRRNNVFFHDYEVIVAAGPEAGTGVKALEPVYKAMQNPMESKTITLSCGKLTTGVTVKPWGGIMMLRNLSTPETYFQAAFRVQSPWVIRDEEGKKKIMKEYCYIFDFALDRALKLISEYSCSLNPEKGNPEEKVQEFIKFLPVLAYDGSSMREVSAVDILDMAMSGTSATLLAKRWESALLVNVDNVTLTRLMNNKKAMDALMKIEGFRSLNSDITAIITKSNDVKNLKKNSDKLSKKQKNKISKEEKEYRSKRREIQEKLIKFATRVPIFMYLTDFREYSLRDVINDVEPDLFKKVTGLDVSDFELLVSLNLFNESLMNDAVYKFKRYEDASLSYTGVNKHANDKMVGLYSTSVRREDYERLSLRE